MQQEENFQSASSYYNKDRKRSFLFSRIAVIASMLVLVITLSLNLSVLNTTTNTSSQAASNTVNEDSLPKLPNGCEYQHLQDGPIVVCTSPTPEKTAFGATGTYKACQPVLQGETYILQCTDSKNQRVTVPLQLPEGCDYQQTPESYEVVCGSATKSN